MAQAEQCTEFTDALQFGLVFSTFSHPLGSTSTTTAQDTTVRLRSQSTGYAAFFVVLVGLVIGIGYAMKPLALATISTFFPGYTLHTDLIDGEWVLYNLNDVGKYVDWPMVINQKSEDWRDIYNPAISLIRKGIVRETLREKGSEGGFTLYYIRPWVAFGPIILFLAVIVAFLASLFIPGSLIHEKLKREKIRLRAQIEKQCQAHQQNFDALLAMETEEREEAIRLSSLPEVTAVEMDDLRGIQEWFRRVRLNPFLPIRFFFRYRISQTYGNVIQGFVSGGAAILIFVIGLRGLKIIPAEEPSIILMALSIEFILLLVLMLTFMGSMQEERLDRVVKELEADQREVTIRQTAAICDAVTGSGRPDNGSPDTLAAYEEEKLLDEILSRLLAQAEKREKRA